MFSFRIVENLIIDALLRRRDQAAAPLATCLHVTKLWRDLELEQNFPSWHV